MRTFVISLVLLTVFAALPAASQPSSMQVPRQAPEWEVSEWINGKAISLSSLKGKIVIVDFFQLWCPGCNGFSIPLLKTWEKTFQKEISEGKLVIVSIHTVFEGHGYQNNLKLKKFLKRKNIHHLVGVDRHEAGQRIPKTMRVYGTMGTPEMAFIDQKGMVRFQEFGGFDVDRAESLLRSLLKIPSSNN